MPGDPDSTLAAFLEWVDAQGLSLYPAQEEAILALGTGANVILATPTGSGKSLVAVAAHALALANGQRSWYTAPIKALVSEKFFALCAVFGADQVGMMTGDAAVNPDAPIICATAEVLANRALREGDQLDLGVLIMDEFHFYAEPDRGWAWQVPLLLLTRCQFLLMSATLGDTDFFERDIARRTGRETVAITTGERPVPLHFSWAMTAMHETIEELLAEDRAPIYIVHFTQASAIERAQALMSVNVTSKAEKVAIDDLIGHFRFGKGFGTTLSRLVRHGIGVHHAGMLPKYRRLVETLAQAGLLKVICGTDTLGVGINVPIRTVLLTSLTKYDGRRQRVLRAREFHQIAGRAGRAGYDTDGYVVVQAPEYVIDNARAVAKAGDDPKKLRRVVRKKPPEGVLGYSGQTYDRLVAAPPEPLRSRMRVTHAMLLNVLDRVEGQRETLRILLQDNHEDEETRERMRERAALIVTSLLTAGVIEPVDATPADLVEALPDPLVPDPLGPDSPVPDSPVPDPLALDSPVPDPLDPDSLDQDSPVPHPLDRDYRVVADLQQGFALNQPLSAFALAALDLLDRDAPTYALDVVSVIEATLEDPRPVLFAQQFEARGLAVAEMKYDGIEYDERMELLEEVTWPKPLAPLLEAALGLYQHSHPWVHADLLSPKSVVRDLYERAMNFGEFVAHFKLARAEGVVLRYLTDAYRALRQTVPLAARTDDLEDLIEWLGELVRHTDSSLLDEWERLANPSADPDAAPVVPSELRGLSANPRALRVAIRQAMFRRVELVARRRWEQLAELDDGLSLQEWADAGGDYFAEYDEVGTGMSARGGAHFLVETTGRDWVATQIIEDPDGDHDWRIIADIDLDASDEAGELVLHTRSFAPTG